MKNRIAELKKTKDKTFSKRFRFSSFSFLSSSFSSRLSNFLFLENGFSLVEVIIGLGIIVILFAGIYMVYYSLNDVISNTRLRGEGAQILSQQIELIRNLSYANVGVTNGIPSGVLPQIQNMTSTTGAALALKTSVRNIDDPFDGTFPSDTAPADYKLVELELDCVSCAHFTPLVVDTYVAPKNLESTSANGSLLINVFDANGTPVKDAMVQIINSSTVPSINFTDVTNASGTLQLVNVPTSTQGYQVVVTKSGYSTDQTYPPGAPLNPSPTKPNLTVVAQGLTQASFQIDRTSTLSVNSLNAMCAPLANQSFSVQGTKLIGTPNVLKFSTTTTTDGTGQFTFNNLEWDTYKFGYGGNMDLLGTVPLSPDLINPNTSSTFYFVLRSAQPDSLLVAATGPNGPLQDATVTVSLGGFTSTQETGHAFWIDDFSSSTSITGVQLSGGSLSMISGASGFNTSTPGIFTSRTIDLGTTSAKLFGFTFSSASEPAGTDLKFQFAGTNDPNTWNFSGPSGVDTFYTSPGQLNGAFDGFRYIRYRTYFDTSDASSTPTFSNMNLEYRGACTPPGQILFSNLSAGTYTVRVDAAGFSSASTTANVASRWQQISIPLSQ